MGEEFGRMTKTEMLQKIRQERQKLEALLQCISPEQMETPGVAGEWSVKDLLAHIVYWEQCMVHWLKEATTGQVPVMLTSNITGDDLDQINQTVYEQNRHRPLKDVQEEFRRSFQLAVKAVEDSAESDLCDAQRFPWRKGRPLWLMVAGNTWFHYQEHGEGIQAWLKSGDQT